MQSVTYGVGLHPVNVCIRIAKLESFYTLAARIAFMAKIGWIDIFVLSVACDG